jgi:hypothetical protein
MMMMMMMTIARDGVIWMGEGENRVRCHVDRE